MARASYVASARAMPLPPHNWPGFAPPRGRFCLRRWQLILSSCQRRVQTLPETHWVRRKLRCRWHGTDPARWRAWGLYQLSGGL